ncbi:MAG: hypothetical protein ACYTXA_00940 [Nostoc sp.]
MCYIHTQIAATLRVLQRSTRRVRELRIAPKGWSSGLDEPGTPLAKESLAMILPSAVKVAISRNDEG